MNGPWKEKEGNRSENSAKCKVSIFISKENVEIKVWILCLLKIDKLNVQFNHCKIDATVANFFWLIEWWLWCSEKLPHLAIIT